MIDLLIVLLIIISFLKFIIHISSRHSNQINYIKNQLSNESIDELNNRSDFCNKNSFENFMELSDSLENERQLKSDLNLLRNDISKRDQMIEELTKELEDRNQMISSLN